MGPIMIEEILASIPHRYPFILIDRILDCEVGAWLTAVKNVTINEPFFQGHFPQNPIMPGVLILEAMAQASVILANIESDQKGEVRKLHVFAGIDNARFKRIVKPGDQLLIQVTLLKRRRGIWKIQAEATVDGEIACSAELMSAEIET